MDFGIILTTTSNMEEAKKIAHHLVKFKYAACVNIIPKITSIYRWKDNIHEDEEYLLYIKTKKELFKEVKKEIKKLHSYELPEIIMVSIKKGLKEYLEWMDAETITKVKEFPEI